MHGVVTGKSTFLTVLRGTASSYGTVTGTVKMNGRSCVTLSTVRAIVGYVPQEDIVHEDLTVRENLYFSAWLRLSRGKSPHAKANSEPPPLPPSYY